MKTRLRTKLSLRISAIILITSAGAGWYTYSRSVREYEDITTRILTNTSSLVDERMDALLNSAQSSSRLIAALVKPTTGGDGSEKLGEDSLEKMMPALIDMMSVNDLFGSVSITVDSTGRTMRAVRKSDGSLVIHSRAGWGSLEEYRPYGIKFVKAGGYNDPFDPRQFEHYKQCKETREPTWSMKGEVRPALGVRSPAATVASPILTQKGEFVGVATVSLTLEDLSRFLQTIRVSDRGAVFLVDMVDKPSIVAYPDASRLLVFSGGTQRLVGVEQLGNPALPNFLRRISSEEDAVKGQLVRETFMQGSEQWQGSWMMLEGSSKPRWATCVLIPSSDFTAGVRETAAFVLFGTAIALGLGVVMTLFVAQRISRPLGELVRETRRIQEMDFAERPLPNTDVIEIQELSSSIEQVKRGLRSFERLVPSEYARYLIKSGQEARLGGSKQRLTVCFADLVGFTALSESIQPEELGRILEEYLNVLSGEVVKTHGTIDKYNGDDVMAFWGAPVPMTSHALSACQSALGMRDTLERLYPEWRERGIPRLRVSCGIVTGDVIVGNVGSRDRMNYTVIGDSVNLASRLQGLNRLYSTELLIGETTKAEVDGEVLTRLVDWVIPAGKEHSVAVYELLGMRTEASSAQFQLAREYHEAMEAYRLQKWDDAIAAFTSILSQHPQDGPSMTLIERCRRFKTAPPEPDWTGAFRVGFK